MATESQLVGVDVKIARRYKPSKGLKLRHGRSALAGLYYQLLSGCASGYMEGNAMHIYRRQTEVEGACRPARASRIFGDGVRY